MFFMDLYKLSSYDYKLPKELIAQKAHIPADECKLLYCKNWKLKDLIFKDIKDLLSDNDILFFNNSKVVKARIKGSHDFKQDLQDDNIKFIIIWQNWEEKHCKNCEILFLKKLENNIFEALVRPWKKFKIWTKIKIENQNKKYFFEVLDFTSEWRKIKYLGEEDIFEVLEQIWKMPLPPYIEYSKEKESPYQPVQAKKEGSVAAPTASLHFTKQLFEDLKQKWVEQLESTLHIWIWTFKVVDVEDITKYDIHSEMVEIPIDIFKKIFEAKKLWKKVVAVGTTWTRILESLPYLYRKLQKINSDNYQKIKNDYFDGLELKNEDIDKFIDWDIFIENDIIYFDTKLYIFPWFKYKIVDKLITNFHLPKSSLLMLVAAFMWFEDMMNAYEYAIKNKYRFFSFWDAMFIE